MRSMKDCSRRNGLLSSAVGAQNQPIRHQPTLVSPTPWADKSIWPPEFLQVVETVEIAGKPLLHVSKSVWISLVYHGGIVYILWLVESTA